jgi:hypothetical protein
LVPGRDACGERLRVQYKNRDRLFDGSACGAGGIEHIVMSRGHSPVWVVAVVTRQHYRLCDEELLQPFMRKDFG